MVKIFFDTDILIDYTFGKSKLLYTLLNEQKKREVELFINPIVTAEFLNDRNLLDTFKLKKAVKFLSLFQIIEIDVKLGIVAGQLLRENKIIFLSNALIAATCVNNTLLLATRNRKHFDKVPHLQFYSPKRKY